MSAKVEPRLSSDRCLVRAVSEAMQEEPALEAVKIDTGQQLVSVATLGRSVAADLESRLSERIAEIQRGAGSAPCALLDGSADCAACPAALQGDARRRLAIQREGAATTISRVTCVTAPKFWRWRHFPLPRFVPREPLLPDEEDHEQEWKQQLVAAGLCGAFGLAAWFARGHPAGLAFSAAAYLTGGWFAAQTVWERLREGALDVHFLMLAVAAGSASVGAWAEGAALLFLFSTSGALEHYAMGRTHREIRALFRTAPKQATLLDERGQEQLLPVEQLQPGMRLLVRPGEQFPVDVELIRGSTAADESNLTGESAPVEKTIGDPALAGSLNLWGVVEAVVLRAASQSALQKIIQLIREAQRLKAPSQRFTDRFGTRYTYAILSLTLVMFFVWWLGFGLAPFVSVGDARSAFYRSMILLVVASPCALVLSIPSAILAAIAWAARHGILFRGGAAVEKLAEVTVVAMDKTGTLTTGELQVETVESFPPGREADVARLAFSLERLSNHPLARAVTRYGKQRQLAALTLDQFESVTGLDLRARQNGRAVFLGRREWLAEVADLRAAAPDAEPGRSEVWVAGDGVVGRLVLRDEIRPEAAGLIARLRELGLHPLVLTGDRRAAAARLQ